jgi:hypothetical protein
MNVMMMVGGWVSTFSRAPRAGTKGGDFDADELKKLVIREFANQFFTLEQVFVADVAGNTLKFQVIDLSVVDLKYVTGETNKKEGRALPPSPISPFSLSFSQLHCTLCESCLLHLYWAFF